MKPHPLVSQLRFTRAEFLRSIRGVNEEDARKRLKPMNCISWNIGHLAWQEQRYCLYSGQEKMPFPDINEQFAYGAPASTPPLKEVLSTWKKITAAADPWLNTLTSVELQQYAYIDGRKTSRTFGNLVQRMIYQNSAITPGSHRGKALFFTVLLAQVSTGSSGDTRRSLS